MKYRNYSPLWDIRAPYSEEKKTLISFCSNFMSFYPIDFIFIGCIGQYREFFWVPRNFDFFTHKRNIFAKMLIFDFSKKVIFGGVMSKIEFGENWPYRYGLYYGFGSKKP